MSLDFSPAAALAPRLVSSIGIVCAVPVLIRAIRDFRGVGHTERLERNPYLIKTLQAFVWMAAFVALTWLFGLFVAVLILVPVFTRHFAQLRWRSVAIYTAGVFVALSIAGWSGDIAIPMGDLGGIPLLIEK
jgi:hypothetical protein